MGLLDRFKKDPSPDALTWEAVARARATAGVAGAEPVDADTISVTWAEHPGTTTLSLADVREEWAKASGFARIELMDQVVAGLAPPGPTDPPAPTHPAAPTAPGDDDPARRRWDRDRGRLEIVVSRPGAGHSVVRWPIAGGSMEARATLDGGDVTAADLQRWDAAADDARRAAVEALLHLDPRLDPIAAGQPGWVPTVPDAHPPVWLAAPARLLEASGLPAAVVLAPTPTELVVVDPDADELLASVLSGTKGIVAGADEVLLAAPLIATADGLSEWSPDPSHPCAALVADLRKG